MRFFFCFCFFFVFVFYGGKQIQKTKGGVGREGEKGEGYVIVIVMLAAIGAGCRRPIWLLALLIY